MSSGAINKSERVTQNRIVKLFTDLGYEYLGDWTDRYDNSNIEIEYLDKYLEGAGYSSEQISKATYQLKSELNDPNLSLYQLNQKIYSLLRYGVNIKLDAGKPSETVKLIDWQTPANNNFYIAE